MLYTTNVMTLHQTTYLIVIFKEERSTFVIIQFNNNFHFWSVSVLLQNNSDVELYLL